MLSGLRGRGEPQLEEIQTALSMEVKLAGPTFDVDSSRRPSEQLIIPTPAYWEFDVLPLRSGQRQIMLTSSCGLQLDESGRASGSVGPREAGWREVTPMSPAALWRAMAVANPDRRGGGRSCCRLARGP